MNGFERKQEFARRFSEISCIDDDVVLELLVRIDSINGLIGIVSQDEFYFSFVVSGIAHQLVVFSVKNNFAEIYISPSELFSSLESAGIFPFEANEFYSDFLRFCNIDAPDEPYSIQKLSVDINLVFEEMDDFVDMFSDFIGSILS